MKPVGAFQSNVACDLSEYSLYYGLAEIGFEPPEITITINPKSYYSNTNSLPLYNIRARIIFDDTYKYDEWSVSINDKTYWSPGA